MAVHDPARALPEVATLRDRCRALATLDAVLSPEWEWRYYSFDSRWGPGEEMASMAYRRFAEDYDERPVDGRAGEIFALRPLTEDLVRRLNPERTVADLADDLAEVGYPSRPL